MPVPAAPGPDPREASSTGWGAHAALLQTARLSSCPHTTRPRPWPFVTGCQLGHTVHVPPKPSSTTTAFPGPTRGQGRCACSPGLGTPVLPAEQRVGKRLCAEPAHSPRGLAGLGGLHCLSVQAPPAKQQHVGRAPRGEAPRVGQPPAPSPRLAPHSPLDQEALGPRGSHVALGGHLFQEGRWGLGHPEIRAIGEFLTDAQDQGGQGAGRGLVFQIRSGPRLEVGLPRALGFKRNLRVLTRIIGWQVHALERSPSSQPGACAAGWLCVWLGDGFRPGLQSSPRRPRPPPCPSGPRRLSRG